MKKWNQPNPFFLLLLAFCSAVLLALLISVVIYLRYETASRVGTSRSDVTPPQYYRLLDGQVTTPSQRNLRPRVVIIENFIDSRPTAGLEDASVIYEMIVEGDVTRYLAIFDGSVTTKKIGPVRSVRPFLVSLMEEWNPVLFHAGGSPEGLAAAQASSVVNVNEISGDGIYFWRDTSRDMPHNLYTSAALMARAMSAKAVATTTDFLPWRYKNEPHQLAAQASVPTIVVPFSSHSLYRVEYHYNTVSNDYTRYLNDEVHKTERGIILKTNNIIVQHVDYDIIDDYGRLDIDVENGGVAEVYQDGGVVSGYWKKADGRTRFYRDDGQAISLNRGVTWVELVFY